MELKIKRPLSIIPAIAAMFFGGFPTSVSLIPSASAQTQIDIRSFGASCNGSDDTGAVQAALNALPNGGTLIFSCQAGITQVAISNRSNITIAGANGGGVVLRTQTADVWSRAFAVNNCSSCTIRDMVFEGNNKDMIAFNIENSSNSTVSGSTIRNVRHAGAAFLALHNNGNKYLNNTLQNVGMDRGPMVDTTRGLWAGNVSDETKETNVTISGNTFIDISGTAIAAHGSGMTITGNTGTRLNASCVKVLPLGGSGSTLIANNNCSGAGGKYWIGGGIMTEYYNSANESTVIRDNTLEGYAEGDVARVPDCPNNGIAIANPPGRTSNNVQILNNTVRNFLYDSIQISGPTDNFVIDGNRLERTISSGTQWNGIGFQGDFGKVITNGTIKRNMIRGKFDGIRFGSNGGGSISGVTLDSNSIVSMSRDGVHIEVESGGQVSNVSLTNNCFSAIGGSSVWDNRSNKLPLEPVSGSCSGPVSGSVSITSPTAGQTVSGTVTMAASATSSLGTVSVQFKVDGVAYGAELGSAPFARNWDTRSVANGTHQITAEARDAAGNRTTSAPVVVTVSNTSSDTTRPTVSITSPTGGQAVSGTISLAASASDNVGVAGVQIRVDGAAYGAELTGAPYARSWDSRSVANGTHQITAVARDSAGNTTTSAAVSVTVNNTSGGAVPVPTFTPIRVNAGGAALTDATGKVWSADTGSAAGHAYSKTNPISGAATQALYQTQRWNNKVLDYQFAVPNGNYAVTLKFAELYFGSAGQRVFDVSVNGQTKLSGFDIVGQAGGAFRAVDRSMTVSVTDGKIAIHFVSTIDDPAVNAIEIVQGRAASTPPVAVRINAGGPAFTDAAGLAWAADSGGSGGYEYSTTAAIANTTSAELYRTLRWDVGRLVYQFAVPNGTYRVTLKFAEIYFTATGQRVFNAAINGQSVLSGFDIIAAAGGANRAVDRSFTVTVTGGRISIDLNGVIDDPQINAIEITN